MKTRGEKKAVCPRCDGNGSIVQYVLATYADNSFKIRDKQVLDDTLNRIVAHKDHPNYTAERAIIASAQGDFDLLVEEIERHYLNGHIAYVHSLISNPFLAPVLKEPRVQVIVKKMRPYTE